MLLKDRRVEEEQSFKSLSVYISIKYRKPQYIKTLFILFNLFTRIVFLVDSSTHFLCARYFYPYFCPIVKRNKKIFYLISFEVIKIENVLKLILVLIKNPSRFRAYIWDFTVLYLPFLSCRPFGNWQALQFLF